MNEETLKRIIVENQEAIFEKSIIKRNYQTPDSENINVLIGIRRCGKTYTLYEKALNFDKENILFLDFEDERLIFLNSLNNYDIIIDSYKSIYLNKKPILFFDEIQNLKNWHLYLKRLHIKGYKIYVTGSNANLISREIATFLKGRSIEITIHPFSFIEFIKLKNIEIEASDYYANIAKILNMFDEYLQFGGFPEVIKVNYTDKRAIAKNIYNLLFYKDIVAKYDKNDYLLKLIVNKIAENITKEFSITNLSKKIMSVYKTTVPTVTDYFGILPEPFLTTNIYQYRTSFVQRQSKRKTYLMDNSFIFLNRITTDKSRLFENVIFNFLQRIYTEIYYYKTQKNKEVDFLVNNNNKIILIQASYDFSNQDTQEREITSIVEAMRELNLKKGYIYTYNTTDKIVKDNKKILVLPFWRVALKNIEITSK